MGGRKGLRGLPPLPPRWRPDRALRKRGKHRMETPAGAQAEDLKRARAADRAQKTDAGNLLPPGETRRLIRTLKRSPLRKRQKPSLASMVSIRMLRVLIIGWLWKLFVDPRWGRATTVHIAPHGWDFTPRQLLTVNPQRLLAELRASIYREGAAKAGGYLIVFLDCEFAPHSGLYRIHVHGVAAGGMIEVINRLRQRKKYKREGAGSTPVVIKRKRISWLPGPLTYLLKPDWFAVWRGTKKNGSVGKSRKQRIGQPYGTLAHVWLNRWTIDDITLRIHLTVGADGFTVTNQNRTRKEV